MTAEEIFLLQKIKQGDEQAFQIIFENNYKPLCLTAGYFVNELAIAEEIVQDLFVKFWEQKDTLEINSSVSSYLNIAVKNKCRNHLAHEKVKKRYQENYLLNERQQNSCDQLFTDPYLKEKISSSIEKLPPKRRQIFEMSRFKGYKYREIADELQISQKTVEAQMGKALASLYLSLKEYLPILLILMTT
jgi:RNA polymerase sigma-70 factor (ECF subfamily)